MVSCICACQMNGYYSNFQLWIKEMESNKKTAIEMDKILIEKSFWSKARAKVFHRIEIRNWAITLCIHPLMRSAHAFIIWAIIWYGYEQKTQNWAKHSNWQTTKCTHFWRRKGAGCWRCAVECLVAIGFRSCFFPFCVEFIFHYVCVCVCLLLSVCVCVCVVCYALTTHNLNPIYVEV